MKTVKLMISAALVVSVSVADVTYTYENDGKTYVATVANEEGTISADAVTVLDSGTVTNFMIRGDKRLIVDKGSAFTGDVHVELSGAEDRNMLLLQAENPLGVAPGTIYLDEDIISVAGAVVRKNLHFDCGETWSRINGIMIRGNGSSIKSTIMGKTTFTDRNFFLYLSQHSLEFNGGLEGPGYLYVREGEGAEVKFSGRPVDLTKPVSFQSAIKPSGKEFWTHFIFSVENNIINSFGNSNAQDNRFTYSKLSTTVDWAFDNASMKIVFGAGSLWDLCGTSQRVGCLDANRLDKDKQEGPLSVITNSSSDAAFLYLNQTVDSAPQVVFGGDISVGFSGSKTTTIDHPMTASGEIAVNGGTLAFTADGSWTDATKVSIADGAAVSVVSGNTFGDLTEISLNGSGALSIAAGEGGSVVTQTVGFLTIDGTAKSSGFYEAGGGVLEVLYSGRRDVTDSALEIGEGESFTLDDTVLCGEFDRIILGAGAKLGIETEAFFLSDAAFTLTLGTGSELTLAEGIDIHVASATVDGVVLAPGRYSSSDLDWLKGGGEIFIPYGTIDGTDATWTAGGSDTLMTTPGNWSSAVDLENGAVRAVFSSGSESKVVGDTFLNGIVFNASGAFDVAAADGNALLRLSSGGITSAGAGENTISSPVRIDGDQTWQIDTPLTVSGSVVSDPLARYSVSKKGAKDLIFAGGGNFSGDLVIDEATIRFSGAGIMSSPNGRVVINKGTLVLSAAECSGGVLFSSGGGWNDRGISVWGGESAIQGKVLLGNRNNALNYYKGARLTLSGGCEDANSADSGYFYIKPSGGGSVIFAGKPLRLAKALYINRYQESDEHGYSGYVTFAVPGNSMPSFGYAAGSNDYRFHGCMLRTTVDWAFDNAGQTMMLGHDSKWDLCGTSQRVGFLDTVEYADADPTEITCSTDATAVLYLNQTKDSTPWVDFTGNLSVDFTGNYTTTVNRAMTAEGDITVNSGVLAFVEGGSWRKARNIEVNGSAKITVAAGETFHRTASLSLESMDSLDIASGASFRVAKLSVGGAEMPCGDYSFGSGTLSVGPVAMRVIVR